MTNSRPRVAVIADKRRQDAVAQALFALGDAWPEVAEGVIIKPNLVSHNDLRASTHPITLGALADFIYARGATEITIAEGASDATAGFANLGHQRMFWKRPVRWFDINRDEHDWQEILLRGTDGSLRASRLSRTMATAPLVVSVAQAKTHVNTMLTASMKNLMSCIHPQDRIQMHGYKAGGNGHSGLKGRVIEWLKGESTAVGLATTMIGRMKQTGLMARWLTGRLQWEKLSGSQREFCRSIAALHTNLVRLNQAVGPRLAVVDGFSAMDGEGPRLGRSRNLGWVVAGTDLVAVDTVVAKLMGMNTQNIGYLVLGEKAGLGTTRLENIEIVGDSISSLQRRCRLHSHAPLQQFWPQALADLGEGQKPLKKAADDRHDTAMTAPSGGKKIGHMAEKAGWAGAQATKRRKKAAKPVATLISGRIRMNSRLLHRWQSQFPPLVAALAALLILTNSASGQGRRSQAREGWMPAEAIAQTVLLHQTPNDASFVTDSIRRGELLWVREISPESDWFLVRPPEGALSWVLESDISEIRNGEARVKAARTLIRPGRVGARLPGPPGSELVSGDRIWLLNREPLVLPQQGRLMTWRAIEPPAGEPRFARRENLKLTGKSTETDEPNGFVNAAGPGNLTAAKPLPGKSSGNDTSPTTRPESKETPSPSIALPETLTDNSNNSDQPQKPNPPQKVAEKGQNKAKPSIESLAILEPPKSLVDTTTPPGLADSLALPKAMPFEQNKSAKPDEMQFGNLPVPAEPAASPLALPDSPDAALEILESRFRVLMDQPLVSWNFKPILDGCDSLRKRSLSPEQAGRLNAIRDKAQRQDEIGQSSRKFWDSMRRSRAHDPGKNPDIDIVRASNGSRFDITGLLLPSRRDLDGQLLYNLIGDGGSTIAYLKLPPAAPVERWLGKKVGIRGRVRYNEDLRARLVVVQDVELVEDENS